MLSLSHDFAYQTFYFPDDYEGQVTATLIAYKNNIGNRPAILWLPGYNDYFFQVHVAAYFISVGIDFYALEPRKYGNSILPVHQHPNYCRSFTEYFSELDKAIDTIVLKFSAESLTLLGHNTGGVIASLYANLGKYRHKLHKLILNAPLLGIPICNPLQKLSLPWIKLLAKLFPFNASSNSIISPKYLEYLTVNDQSEWQINQQWKRPQGLPTYYAWWLALLDAQHYLHHHSIIEKPILIVHAATNDTCGNNANVAVNDVVAAITDYKRYGEKLGPYVSWYAVQNACHDVTLSKEPARSEALTIMGKFCLETVVSA
ncbi:MAG: alpha/beta fold hydrolase [Chitinophagaceae bacterium]